MFGNNTFGNTSFGNTAFGSGFGTTPTLGAFGSSPQTATQPAGPIGTTIRFVPLNGTDTVQKPGSNTGPSQITTRHQNISAMKEYEQKSVEELRLEDYAANRKVGQPPLQTAFNPAPFGSMQPSTSHQNTSIFGSNTQQTPNLFGTPSQSQTTSIFGQPRTGFEVNGSPNMFSSALNKPATTAPSSIFNMGTPANTNTSTSGGQTGFSLFNNNTQTNSTPFGASTANSPFKTNMFASPATNTGSLFNTSTNTSGFLNTSQNTAQQPASIFGQPKTGFEVNSGSNMFSSALNKPATTAPSSIFNMGTPTNTNTSTASGQTGFSLFNNNTQTNPTPFGASTANSPFKTNMFASPATNTGSLFNTSTNTSGFLNTSQNTAQQPASIFGQPKTGFEVNSGSNMFSSALNKPATTAPSSIFNMGTPTNTNTSTSGGQTGFPLFNNNTQTNSTPFGASTGNMFASPATNTGSLFNTSTNANTSGFLNTNQNTATQPTTFGTNTSIFGSTNNATSPFGQNSLFNTQPKTGFELNNTSNSGLFGNTLNKPAVEDLSNNKIGQQQTDLLLNRLKTLPYGETSLFLNNTSNSNQDLGSLKFTTDPKTINQYKMSAKTNVKLNKPASTEKPRANSILFDGLDDNTNDDLRCAIDVFVPKKNIKKLDLKPSSYLSEGDADRTTDSPIFDTTRNTTDPHNTTPGATPREFRSNISADTSRHVRYADNTFPGSDSSFAHSVYNRSTSHSDVSSFRNTSLNLSRSSANSSIQSSKSGVINTRPDYKIKPSLEEIERRFDSERDVCMVDSLLIERPNFGAILFPETLNVKGINIDEIVHIRRKEVIVYPDDENKPPKGQGLNRPATVTLHQVWPTDKSTNEPISDVNRLKLMRYPEKIEAATLDKGARFIEYKPETGSWMFAVKHFSKYGITDDDEETTKTVNQYKMNAKTKPNLDKQTSPDKPKTNSVLFDSFEDTSNYSMRNAIDELFDADEESDSKVGDFKRSLTVHGTKRLALQNVSLNMSSTSYERPIIDGATVPKQQKVREIKPKPDLHAARNKLQRDIMSVCVSGSPKVRFFNGSRKFCYIQGDNVVIQELKLVPTTPSGSLTEDLRDRFENFLENNSLVTPLNMNPILAPYIETYDFIPNASSHDLLHALYGNLSSKTPYGKQAERLNRVIKWLASTNRKLQAPSNLYQQIIYHMSCDRYDLASTLAIENCHPRLALLIATLNINDDLMLSQLTSWRQSGADQYIEKELLKIYVLLSKQTEWKISDDTIVDCLKGLSWSQKLCLLALHVPSLRSDQEKYGFHMLPLYIKKLGSNINDVNYHILARHNPADIISAAETLVEEWFLLEALKSFHVINSDFECNHSDLIHCNLASQLGPIDLRWACFVALHIINNEVRNQVLVKCLEQNYQQLSIEINNQQFKTVESWLLGVLKIPGEFIENSKNLAKKEI